MLWPTAAGLIAVGLILRIVDWGSAGWDSLLGVGLLLAGIVLFAWALLARGEGGDIVAAARQRRWVAYPLAAISVLMLVSVIWAIIDPL